MRHARAEALDLLEPLIAVLRTIDGLSERSRGVFYRKSQAFLHFHEDPEGLFADVRDGADFTRYRVTTAAERRKFLTAVRRAL
ncbi:MAG: hypothetical protein K8R18_01955 [Parvibaculum sp.]|uniref:hypothetical protein n=1 Tax=Parvibaculum sp. TaxID=2024848 RepID=UPI0025D8AE1C|nr:hypothetical protein [Parvibaculum sp.]MCE9648363.1 hypothetical protein [Parvibaculum sp.]